VPAPHHLRENNYYIIKFTQFHPTELFDFLDAFKAMEADAILAEVRTGTLTPLPKIPTSPRRQRRKSQQLPFYSLMSSTLPNIPNLDLDKRNANELLDDLRK
jgi:hypothetical protein